jgi:hypothetical protein
MTEFEIVYKEDEPETHIDCNICLGIITKGKKLSCGHVFHVRCIK